MGKDAAEDTPFARPVTFADPIESSKKMVELLKNQEKTDIIVCLSHAGTSSVKKHSEDENIAREVPQIDVIISGHTHTFCPNPLSSERPSLFPQALTALISVFWTLIIQKGGELKWRPMH